jgi:very-short-patch-repair endonuclease
MWEIFRNRNFFGYKFRRQHPLGRYIADFYSEELRLVIEIDGKVHENVTQQEYDIIRDLEIKNR